MKRKIAILLLLIGILSLGLGMTMYLLNDNNQQEKPKKEQPVQQEQPQEQPQEDVTENNNEFIKEEHCLEKICVETITIKKDLTTNKILVTGELTNKGTTVEPAGYIKFLVQHDGEEFYKVIQYPEIQPNAKVPINFEGQHKVLLYAIDYNLVTPTDRELASINNQ